MKILDADKAYLFPDVEHMEKWFDEFNGRFFNNELPHIELSVWYRGKNTMGGFHKPTEELPIGFHPEKCWIMLNALFFDSEDEWRNTMVHEMVHYYVYMKHGTSVRSHGKEFKAEAKRINAISEFKIDTYVRTRTFRPKPSITDNWGSHFEDEIILGRYRETIIEELEDDETHEIVQIHYSNVAHIFSFRTKRRYIPEIIDNMRNVSGEIDWFQVDACCQKLFLLPVTTAVPSFKTEDIYRDFDEEKDLLNDFGPVKWTHLGTTTFREDGVQGYSTGQRKEDIRQKYFRDAEEIGHLAAKMLVKRYREHPRWYTSSVHGTYQVKPSCGEYTIQIDSRFNLLVAMTPKRILINPVHSAVMMDAVKSENTEFIAKEITRVILSRQKR